MTTAAQSVAWPVTPREYVVDRSNGTSWKSSLLVESYLEELRSCIPMHREQLEMMRHLIASHGVSIERFLDLGCGDGLLGAMILERYPDAGGVFVDFSEPMLQVAGRKLGHYAASQHFLSLDYGNPAWVTALSRFAPFDLIVSGYSIHHQPDARKRQLYAEIRDLLAPGGLFLNVEYVAVSRWGEALFEGHLIDRMCRIKQQQGQVASWEQVAASVINRADKADDIVAPVEQQCEWLRELGFEDVDCYFKVLACAVFGGRRAGGLDGEAGLIGLH